MYPASAFVSPNPPATTLGRMLVHLAAIVLMFGSLVVFVAMRPDPAFLEQRGAPVPSCSFSFGGRQSPCRLVVPDRRIPQRIAIGFGAISVAGGLLVAATRSARSRPTAYE
jgi:hypothetical protein